MKYIDSVERLRNVDRKIRRVLLVGKLPDYQFAIPELSASANHEASRLVNEYKNDCGCSMGAICLGIGVLCIIGYFLIDSRPLTEVSSKELIFSAVLIVGSALIGKVAGLLLARFRLLNVVNNTVALLNGSF